MSQTTERSDSDSESDSSREEEEEAPPTVKIPTRKTEVPSAVPVKFQAVIKYHTDQGFRPLLCAFRNLQWRDFANRGRWHMFWANVANARALFQPGQRYYFNDDQLVNHYQSCYQLSRKDNMTKNIKKFRMEMAHLKDPIGKKDRHGNFLYLDLIAPTYLLPFDFNTFLTDFKKNGGLYIVKPCSGSQGQGIFLVNQLDQAKRWQEKALAEIAACVQDNEGYQGYLISRYIANPLLIDGKKFDLRIYILVTSFKPLRCYYYRQGFCRFCATRYSPDVGNIDDKFMHLTNVAVQKQKKGYNRSHGNKWSLKAFRLYMERVYGRGKIDSLFDKIFWMIVQSLRSVQSLMDNDRHCYEMYGYDCLIDAHLKPWLLEINASPSLEDSTPVDRVIKTSLLSDTMRMALYERCPHLLGMKEKRPDASDMPLGDYEILYLEEPAPKLTPAERVKKANLGRYGSTSGPLQAPPLAPQDRPRWNSM
ncbi:putative tubulin polyglutamylase TTLL1 [Hypsibius exemplaris]|uniref:Tubulin polyglutamylase TTLL1 n=1 Tax=Hypsibius exemplaris TaxID=2072580 RepID=A0A1W0WKH9_HYPEX|nr:putative tubulin polyglutamylase TTLL1 [Hypsibius exemplaris]